MIKTLSQSAAIIFMGCVLSTASVAKEEIVFSEDSVLSNEELANILLKTAPKKNSSQKLLSRGLDFNKKEKDEFISPLNIEPISISFPIKFDRNSSTLNPNSLTHLKQLGTLLNLEKMVNENIMIVGHTDSLGSDSHNLTLSKKRSQSVKDFLVSNYQIEPTRIKTSGKGESSTLPGKSGEASVNRRVEFYHIQ